MKIKKPKEQIIAILTLCSVFVFFIYLKINTEVNESSLSSDQVEENEIINEMIDDYNNSNNASENDDTVLLDKSNDETDIAKNVSENNNTELLVDSINETDSIISFTESELKRAKSYLDRNWKPDHTINIAAWKYVFTNPNFNIDNDSDFNLDENQVVDVIK